MATIFDCLLVTIFVIAVDLLTYAACRFRDNPVGMRDSLAQFSKKLTHLIF
jgi:hypothetical protein